MIRSTALFASLLFAGCDAEPMPPEGDIEARASLSESVAIRYCVERWDAEVKVQVEPLFGCVEGSGYDTEAEETYEQCIDGELVRVTYTRLDFFACVDGEWEHTYSACAVNGCSPKFDYTGESCDAVP